MADSSLDPPHSSSLFKAGAIGCCLGAVFYFVVALGLLHHFFGPQFDSDGSQISSGLWIGRVLSSWINLFTFMAFGAALLMLLSRQRTIRQEEQAFNLPVLGGDEETLLLPKDAQAARKSLKQIDDQDSNKVLVTLIRAGLQRARANWSAEDVADAIKNQAALVAESTDASYAMIRYLAWAIPSIGFVGTVMGIGDAMGAIDVKDAADSGIDPMSLAAGHLNTAFDTTFVALVLSLILMYFVYRIQALDDSLVTRATQWCMQRLVFRMYVQSEATV